ncbi:MAG TPA: carboxypeptidase-like regulatory domain-containing protein [Puia sp.]|jgi:cytoskeletal protein RodZ|nr:carboxypeptidase-like regulatory domain-containing protein [Puia sp.]
MSTNKNTIHFFASDIEKYRKGELSAGEMHDLEQAALDDPFLADAIEGLIQHPISQQDLTDLQERLNKKVSEDTRRKAMLLIRRRIAVAAALILLVGIGFTFFYQHSNQPQSSFQSGTAAKDTARVAAVPTAPAAAVPTAPAAVAANTRSAAESKAAANDSLQFKSAQPQTSQTANAPTRHRHLPADVASTAVASTAPPANQYYAAQAPLSDTQNLTTGLAKQSAAASTADDLKFRNLRAFQIKKDSLTISSLNQSENEKFFNYRAAQPLLYAGKVLDINNRPLAGASLTLNGFPPSGTTTDKEGYFKLSLPPVDTTLQLTVSLIGYNQTSLALNNQSFEARSSNVIYLKPNNTNLDEVVVTGYGAKRRATQAAAPSVSSDRLDTNWISAAPVIGRQAYLQYIRLTKGKLDLDSTVTGTETVSFIVSRDGSLSAFKIEQSLSPAHDAAIIRLVTEGPAWRLFGNKKVRAAVTLNF